MRIWLTNERSQVRMTLADGFGIEDVAVAFRCERDDVRALIKGDLSEWTDAELVDLRRMVGPLGYTLEELAEETGRPVADIRARIKAGLPNLGKGRRPKGAQDVIERAMPIVSPSALAARMARQAAPARDLTGFLLGDPPVGFSALDRIRRSP